MRRTTVLRTLAATIAPFIAANLILCDQAFADSNTQQTIHCTSSNSDFIQLSVTYTRFEVELFGSYVIKSITNPNLNQKGQANGSTYGDEYSFTLVADGNDDASIADAFIIAAPQGVVGTAGNLRLLSVGQEMALNCSAQ